MCFTTPVLWPCCGLWKFTRVVLSDAYTQDILIHTYQSVYIQRSETLFFGGVIEINWSECISPMYSFVSKLWSQYFLKRPKTVWKLLGSVVCSQHYVALRISGGWTGVSGVCVKFQIGILPTKDHTNLSVSRIHLRNLHFLNRAFPLAQRLVCVLANVAANKAQYLSYGIFKARCERCSSPWHFKTSQVRARLQSNFHAMHIFINHKCIWRQAACQLKQRQNHESSQCRISPAFPFLAALLTQFQWIKCIKSNYVVFVLAVPFRFRLKRVFRIRSPSRLANKYGIGNAVHISPK